MTTSNLIYVSAVLLTGLLAGLFYGYDCSVIRGLSSLSDEEYIRAFQSINKAILNPYFFLSFMGSLIILPMATWKSYSEGAPLFHFLLSATIVYTIGVFGITLFGNVPLNDSLEQFDLANSSSDQIHKVRQSFEASWNSFHHNRTYASMLAFLLTILAILKKS